MRLARHVVGTLDVDGMLDQITPEQFEEWVAYDELEPISHQTEMLALIAWRLEGWLWAQAKDGPSPKLEQFMPWLRGLQNRPQNQQAKNLMRARLGGA